jgi:hypothetical protein
MGRGVTTDPSIAHTSSNMYTLQVFPSRLFHHTEGAGIHSERNKGVYFKI